MELLIVGAGAVGSVYANYAIEGGVPGDVRITFLVKPKHRKNLQSEITLYHWEGRKPETLALRNFAIVDDWSEVEKKKFDAVLVTLPSDKMREEGWLEKLLRATGDAAIWSLQPNSNDRAFIRAKFDSLGMASRPLAFGRIPIISYLAPLPGEAFEKPGYAYYVPKGAKALWHSKDGKEAEKAAQTFARGGLPSGTSEDLDRTGILPEALLRSLVAGLENSEWSFAQLLNGQQISRVSEGAREMTAIQAQVHSAKDPARKAIGRIATTPLGIRALLRISQLMIPFDIEAFLRAHFTKVEGQMHLNLRELIATGNDRRLPTSNLSLLLGKNR